MVLVGDMISQVIEEPGKGTEKFKALLHMRPRRAFNTGELMLVSSVWYCK